MILFRQYYGTLIVELIAFIETYLKRFNYQASFKLTAWTVVFLFLDKKSPCGFELTSVLSKHIAYFDKISVKDDVTQPLNIHQYC